MSDDFAVIGRAVTEAITAMASVRSMTPVGSRHWAELDAAVIGLADAAGLLEGLRRTAAQDGAWGRYAEALREASQQRRRSGRYPLVDGGPSLVRLSDRLAEIPPPPRPPAPEPHGWAGWASLAMAAAIVLIVGVVLTGLTLAGISS